MAPSYWFFWTWWLPLILAVVAAEVQGKACSGPSERCGNLNISDPFWLTGKATDTSCGSSDFEVTCNNTTPVLLSFRPHTAGFTIIDISYEDSSLRVVDRGKLKSLRASETCEVKKMNTSTKMGRSFKISPGNLILILYNCTTAAAAAVARRDVALVEMRCGNKSNIFVRGGGRYDGSANYDGFYLEGCIATFLPVLGMSGEANASDYEQLISGGFLLTWDPPPPPGTGKLAHRFVQF